MAERQSQDDSTTSNHKIYRNLHSPVRENEFKKLNPTTPRHGTLSGAELIDGFHGGYKDAATNLTISTARTFRRTVAAVEAKDKRHEQEREMKSRSHKDPELRTKTFTYPDGAMLEAPKIDTEVIRGAKEFPGPMRRKSVFLNFKNAIAPKSDSDSETKIERKASKLGRKDTKLQRSDTKSTLNALSQPRPTKRKSFSNPLRSMSNLMSPTSNESQATSYRDLEASPPRLPSMEHEQAAQDGSVDIVTLINQYAQHGQPEPIKLTGLPDHETTVSYVNRISIARLAFNIGIIKSIGGEYYEGTLWLLKSSKLEPGQVITWFALGNAYSELKKWDKAAGAYKQALSTTENRRQRQRLCPTGSEQVLVEDFWVYEVVDLGISRPENIGNPSITKFKKTGEVLHRRAVQENYHRAMSNACWDKMDGEYETKIISLYERLTTLNQATPDAVGEKKVIEQELEKYITFSDHKKYLDATNQVMNFQKVRVNALPVGTLLAPPPELLQLYQDHLTWDPEPQPRPFQGHVCLSDMCVHCDRTRAWIESLPEEDPPMDPYELQDQGDLRWSRTMMPTPLFTRDRVGSNDLRMARENFPHQREGGWNPRNDWAGELEARLDEAAGVQTHREL